MSNFVLQDWQRAAITHYVNEIRDRYASGESLPPMTDNADYVTMAIVSAAVEGRHSSDPKPHLPELMAMLELKFALPPKYLAAALKMINRKLNL